MSSEQKTIFTASDPERRTEPAGSGATEIVPAKDGPRRLHIWLIRIRAMLFVTLCATFGVLLLILPWTPKWTDNSLLISFPDLRDLISSGFVRGFASGLGVLDLWLGFWEAIHYHESG